MKRHEATLARRCPTCCAPLGTVCYWPGRKTTRDVPHPVRLDDPDAIHARASLSRVRSASKAHTIAERASA